MIPYILTPFGSISTFSIMIVIATLSMFAVLHIILRKSQNREKEEVYIFPKVVFSGVIAYVSSALFDALFKIPENNGFIIRGITFYGGLIGAIIGMYILLYTSKGKTEYSIKQWYEILTLPLITFHIFGRIGCFLGGCCYGKTTDSVFGMYFPDNIENGVFHNGLKCYPTQLFEVVVLILIFILVLYSDKKFLTYLIGYATARFFIEFFRGDDRGFFIIGLSPAQVISVTILIVCIVSGIIHKRIQNKFADL